MHSETNVNVTKVSKFKLEGFGKVLLFLAVLIATGLCCELPDFHAENFIGADYTWWLDMIFHGGYYFVITVILYIFFCKGRNKGIFWIAILLISFVFEFCQTFIPGRTASFLDLLSNFLGISLATLLCSLFYRRAAV